MVTNQEGQTTIEFSLTFVLIMLVVLFFIRLSLFFAYSSYAQYATFMASRAYLSGGAVKSDQETRARFVITQMVKEGRGNKDRWPVIAEAAGGKNDGDLTGILIGPGDQLQQEDGQSNLSWQVGVRYRFKGKFHLGPFGGDKKSDEVTLTSESWLGRETTDEECFQRLDEMSQAGGDVSNARLLIDNGC